MVAPAQNQEQTNEKDNERRSDGARCSFCGALCGRFARWGFLPPSWRRGRARRLRC
jgi:hypothetical protein